MALRRVTIDAEECTCERCGHVWVPKPELDKQAEQWFTAMPVHCSKCKAPNWNVPRPAKRVG
jgi:Zn-finger nucleic acid-binding protein